MLDERSEAVDRKLNLLVLELKRCGVPVAGIQETKWIGRDVGPAAADGYTFLRSERSLPGRGETCSRKK